MAKLKVGLSQICHNLCIAYQTQDERQARLIPNPHHLYLLLVPA